MGDAAPSARHTLGNNTGVRAGNPNTLLTEEPVRVEQITALMYERYVSFGEDFNGRTE
jgi:hypothetical protein